MTWYIDEIWSWEDTAIKKPEGQLLTCSDVQIPASESKQRVSKCHSSGECESDSEHTRSTVLMI